MKPSNVLSMFLNFFCFEALCSYKLGSNKTRPDTRQDSRGRLGRGRNAKTARNSEIFVTDVPMYRPTDVTKK